MAHPFVIFDIIQAFALLLALAVLLPACVSKSVSRMPSWISLQVTCVVYCVSFLVLVGHQSGPEPPLGLCTFQAGLIYAAPPLVASAGLIFAIELHLRMSAVVQHKQYNKRPITRMTWCLPLIHLVIFWVDIFSAIADKSSIERDISGMYCHVIQEMNSLPTLMTGVIVAILVTLMLVIEIYTVIYLFRKRKTSAQNLFTRTGSRADIPLRLLIRMSLCTIVGIGVIIAVVLLNTKTATSDHLYLLCIIPVSISVVFGSQMDIVRIYMFWKRRRPAFESDPLPEVPTPIDLRRALPSPRHKTLPDKPAANAGLTPLKIITPQDSFAASHAPIKFTPSALVFTNLSTGELPHKTHEAEAVSSTMTYPPVISPAARESPSPPSPSSRYKTAVPLWTRETGRSFVAGTDVLRSNCPPGDRAHSQFPVSPP